MVGANTFADGSYDYAAARPRYPDALFAWIAATCRGRAAAWDCATGNGQAALGLAPYFGRVEATDISPEQVAESFALPNVRYSAQPAERTDFPPESFDLIAVAQALHWFDYDLFWPEVRRVARPGALFCAWGYAWFGGPPHLHEALLDPVAKLVEPFWADNNRILWRGYQPGEVRFPFAPIAAPDLRMDVDWSLDQVIGYVRTWSAFKRAANAGRAAALEAAVSQSRHLLDAGSSFRLSVPLAILAGTVPEAA